MITTISDIDECELGTDACNGGMATCTNTEGGYTCSCPPGFDLLMDGITCKGKIIIMIFNNSHAYVLIAFNLLNCHCKLNCFTQQIQ